MKLYRTNVGILPCPVGYHCIVFFPVSKSPHFFLQLLVGQWEGFSCLGES